MTLHRTVQIFLLLLLIPLAANATVNAPDTSRIEAVKINKELSLSGRLDDSVWSNAHRILLGYEMQPNDNQKALQKTYAMVLYNQTTMYIGFICVDKSPKQIRAHISDRDNISNDDYVGVMIDPYEDNQIAYQFYVNPDGIQMDRTGNGHHRDKSYDALWYSRAAVNDTGYTAVIALPFKSLRFPDKKIQSWSVQFVRNYPRNNDYKFSWTKVDMNESCELCQSGELAGLKKVTSHNTVELLPYVIGTQSASVSNSDDPTSKLVESPVHVRAGGSISYAPNSSLSVNAVINPDFSQVETDATQISANNTFAISYPEKRPFFMKGSSMFHTYLDVFHSRVINDPLLAGKMVEKSGNFSLAYLTAYDRNSGFILPGLEGNDVVNTTLASYSNIIRPRLNFGEDSHIGGIITSRNIGESHNYVSALDWNIELFNHYYFNGQVALSGTKELNDTTLTKDISYRQYGNSNEDILFNGQKYGGNALRLEFQRRAKYYTFGFRYKGFSPTFQAQNGFITQTNIRQFRIEQQISYYPSGGILDHGNIHMQGRMNYDYSGFLMRRFLSVDSYNQLTHQTGLFLSYDFINDKRFGGKMFYNLHHMHIGMHSNPVDMIAFGGHVDFGRYIDYDEATTGRGITLSGGIMIKPTSRLNLHLNFDYSELHSLKTGERFYSGEITRLQGSYNFTRQLFVRMIYQYDTFSKQLQIYPLVYYKVNPFTIFYAGMTDYAQNYGQPYGTRPIDRQFFVKFQYLIRE